MSSLLRSTGLLVNFALKRNIRPVCARWIGRKFRAVPSCSSPNFVRTVVTDTAQPQEREESVSIGNLSALEKKLEVMDSNVRWRGRVEREDMERAIAELNKTDVVSEQSGLMMLRCCGSLLSKEPPAKRMELFKQIWDILEKKGVEFRTSHYNARLRIQLENSETFEVADILSEMEASPSRAPNRVTYQLLISRFCEVGDIEGSKKILQHMKNEGMSIGEAVFNSLIRGHLRQGDTTGFEEVLGAMKTYGLYPNADTYRAMFRSHAEKGDMAGIAKVIEYAESDQFNVYASHILPAVQDLVQNGHEDKVEQLLTYAQHPRNYEVLNTMHQLIAQGHDQAALAVYRLLDPGVSPDGAVEAGAKSILRTMISHGRSLEELQPTITWLRESGRLKDDTNSILGVYAVTYGTPALVLEVFSTMKQEGVAVRPHCYWPVLKKACKARDVEGIYTAVSSLAEQGADHPDYLHTLYTHVYKPLLRLGVDQTTVVTRLQECGVQSKVINSLQLFQLLRTGNIKEALTFVQSSPFMFDGELTKATLYQGFNVTEDWRTASELMVYLQANVAGVKQSVFVEGVTNMLVTRRSYTTEDLTNMADLWLEKGLLILPRSLDNIKRGMQERGVEDSVIERLEELKTVPRRREPLSGAEVSKFSTEQLEKELSQRLPRDRDINTLNRRLLMRYASQGDVEKAEALYAQLEGEGFVFGADVVRQMGIMTARFKQDLTGALKSIEELCTKHPEFKSYDSLVLRTAVLQVSAGKPEDAINLLKEHAGTHAVNAENADYALMKVATDMMEAASSTCSPQHTQQLAQALFDGRYVKPGAYAVLEAVVNSYLNKEDFEGLMQVLQQYEQEYNRVPAYARIFRTLIDKEDTESLQKVVDLVCGIQSEVDVLHRLALTLLDAHKYKHAQKVMETPGLRAVMPLLNKATSRLIQTNQEEELKALVNITRDLFACDREEMLFSLMRLYGRQKDGSKCQDVLHMYEEEGLKPRPRTLRYLANVLESCQMLVPFEVPALASTGLQANTAAEKEALGHIMSSDTAQLHHTVSTQTSSMSDDFLTGVGLYLIKKFPPPAATEYMQTLGSNNCEVALQQISMSGQLPKKYFNYANQQRFIAQIRSGNHGETLTELRASPYLCTRYITSDTLTVMQDKCPEALAEVEEVMEVYMSDQGPEKPIAANHLFEFYTCSGQRAKAQHLWESCERMRPTAGLRKSAEALSTDEEGLRWLVEMARLVSPGKTALPYSYLVSYHMAQGQLGAAVAVVQEAKEEGVDYTKLLPTLRKLEPLVLNSSEQIELPWPKGTLENAPKQKPDTTKPSDS